MPDFSAACKQARKAYQDAYDKVRADIKKKRKARFDHKRAEKTVQKARDIFNAAEQALTNANQAWDTLIAKLRADPTLGINGIQAGFQVSGVANPLEALVVGPIPVRGQKDHILFHAGDNDEWTKRASQALRDSIKLKANALQAEKDRDAKKADLDKANTDEKKANDELKKATLKLQQSRKALKDAQANVLKVCGNKPATIPLPGGGTLEIDPFYLPSEEKKIRDILKRLTAKEMANLKKISLYYKLGRRSTYTDPNTGNKVTGYVAGQYSAGEIDMFISITGKPEEVMKHEVGHFVHRKKFNAASRKKWEDFWKKNSNKLKVPNGKMPTGYAGKNDSEGFAEVYEYLKDGKALDPDTKKIIEELLKTL